MPELPEVETVRRGLERTIVGKTVAEVEIRSAKSFQKSRAVIDQYLVGATIDTAERRAKMLILRLSSGWALVIHLKMTGQIVVEARSGAQNALGSGFVAGHPEKAYQQPLPHKHTHVIVSFTDGTMLYFNDLRKFGWMRLFPATGTDSLDSFLADAGLGPEPLSAEFTPNYLTTRLQGRTMPIKSALLDQAIASGVGNIYADEALFRVALHPLRPSSSITPQEADRLVRAIREVLELGIEYGGTTFNSYRTVEGSAGKMREYLKVYGRTGQPCLTCGTAIERMKIGQRSAHFCPNCQQKGKE